MSKRTRALTLAVAALLLLAIAPDEGRALTRFPPGGTGMTEAIDKLLKELPPGQERIRIDDMVFRVDSVTKSGFESNPWPDGVVYYQFDPAFTAAMRDSVRAGCALWGRAANLTFVEGVAPNPFESHIYIFDDGSGNWSEVGYQVFPQEMSIHSWGEPMVSFLVAHEFGHALGFCHEHQRTDRDTYVSIVYANIRDDKEHNYELRDSVNLTPYDFDSIMHYPAGGAFLEPGLVCPPDCAIIVQQPWHDEWQDRIGQSDHLSAYDIQGMATVYGAPCQGPIYVHAFATPVGANGSLARPFPLLAQALAFACDGAEVRLFAGSQPFAPVTIGQHVVLSSYGGTAIIE